MSEEVSVTIGLPEVIKTEAKRGGVEIRAYETIDTNSVVAKSGGFSAHYVVGTADNAPHIGEKLLVAVLSGVHRSWLDIEGDEAVDITFQAVSAVAHGSNDPSRNQQHDTLHLEVINDPVTPPVGPFNGQARLLMSMRNESGSVAHADVVLSKGQVTSMLAALLAIYPRLHED